MDRFVFDCQRRYTEAEYLRISDESDTKYDFRFGRLIPFDGWARDGRGRIVGLAGTSAEHADVAVNLLIAIRNRMIGTDCKVVGSDLRVGVPRLGHYVYPDVTITCGPREFIPPDKTHTLVNPQVVIEVLSAATVQDDWTEKRADYMSIDSLQEYVLFTQDRARADTMYRQADGVWSFGQWAEGLEASITFRSLGVTVPLAEVYAGVVFPVPAKHPMEPPPDPADR